MWDKKSEDHYQLKIDEKFKVILPKGKAEWVLINEYNGDEAKLNGMTPEEILIDALDLLLARFINDIIKIASNTKQMLEYFDNFINKSIEIDENLKELEGVSAEIKLRALTIVSSSNVTNHTGENN